MPRAGGRYAIYFAPTRRSALGRFGRAWLGYDAVSGEDARSREVPGLAPGRLAEITAEPRLYGFHATLKPPFALEDGQRAATLDQALAAFAAARPSFLAPALRLAPLDGFWALTLAQSSAAIDRLAADCVTCFDQFRATPSQEEMERHRRARLSPSQEALLQRWGYPYVFGEFRFHITLTTRLAGAESALLGSHLASLVRPLCRLPLLVDAIALFHQPAPAVRFRLVRRYQLSPRHLAAGVGLC